MQHSQSYSDIVIDIVWLSEHDFKGKMWIFNWQCMKIMALVQVNEIMQRGHDFPSCHT